MDPGRPVLRGKDRPDLKIRLRAGLVDLSQSVSLQPGNRYKPAVKAKDGPTQLRHALEAPFQFSDIPVSLYAGWITDPEKGPVTAISYQVDLDAESAKEGAKAEVAGGIANQDGKTEDGGVFFSTEIDALCGGKRYKITSIAFVRESGGRGDHMIPRFLTATVLLGWLASIGQQEKPTISLRVDSVQIVAVVRDDKGRIRNDLLREDFILEEEGKPAEIEYFARETDVPLTVGLMVDTSMSQLRVLQQAKSATLQFLRQVLRPAQDLAFLISFDVDSELLQNLTNDPQALQRALQEARHPVTQGRPQYGTVLYDAVFLAADEVLKDQSGRKAIIMTSDGADYGSITNLDSALEKAQRADTVIYSIYYSSQNRSAWMGARGGRTPRGGRMPPAGRTPVDGKKVLKKLSEETGGRMFEISGKLTVAEILRQIQEELRSQYVLGFTPPKDFTSKAFRRISLRTKDKKLKVFCRSGYYPQAKANADHRISPRHGAPPLP